MTGSANVSLSRDKLHSNWQSVAEQTGIFAGQGGFDVTAGEHTQLNGAVISSTATADKNRLDTGTLGFGDIENHAEFKAEHAGAGISTGGSVSDQFKGNMANGVLSGLSGSDSADSTTKAAVSEGSIVIRDKENQAQDVATLSRDAENANPGLEVIFDKEKEQNRLKAAQLIGELGAQAGDIARTQGQIIATKAANDKMSGATQADRDRALAELKAKDPAKQYSADDVNKQVYSNFYDQAFAESGFGTGGKVQQAISAVTAAVQGLSGGNIAQAVSGAASPYLAEQIHKLTEGNPEAQAMAHAVVGAVASYASGNNALAGAAGAVSGELMAQLVMKQLYPGKDVSDLTETEKQSISALGTLAAGLAGGVAGNSTADAGAGAQAGKNAVENNSLSGLEGFGKGFMDYGLSVKSYAQYAQDKNLPPEQVQADLARMVKGDLPESANIIKAILENNPGSDTVMAVLSAEDAKDYALALLTSIPAEKALSLVGKAAKVIDNKILISAAEKISTAKPSQSAIPRDLNEQIVWKQVQENPTKGEILPGMNNGPRFPASAGFQKMQMVQKNSKGESITIHYQYNSVTGKAYDMKIDTPQRVNPNPADVIENIKGQVK